MPDLGPIGAARRAAAEREQRKAQPRKPLLTLSTPCAACPHPYNWHKADGCQAGADEETRCGCIAFAIPADRPRRHTADTITDDELDALYERVETYRAAWHSARQRARGRAAAEAAHERIRDICARMRSGSARHWADRIEHALDEPGESP
ncbi:hypothetical protein [Streptomyces marianii]|uniref:Uncharacterized protein n=1 Tax=Streptomyces marianii TaxID=1817406 RepID=A0A5R9ECT7_9ACTN|nr:hypothetical protein [Streptomyces marianii]TLQ45783.1 hypothetical protein FEF34_24795 [Streptomyces marianii]